MRRAALLVCLLVGCAARRGPAPAAPAAPTTTTPAPAWAEVTPAAWADLQQQMSGKWKADIGEGRFIRVSYRVISAGSAMVETFVGPGGGETISVYHPDGAQMVLTHYCAQGNQVRLRAVESAPGRLLFRFLDATNVAPTQGVLRELGVTIGPDGFDQRAVYRAPSGEEAPEVLHFVRDRE